MGPTWRVPRATEACLVWLASAIPFLIEPFFAAGRFAGVSRAALAALPWIAWVGLPRAGSTSSERDPAGGELEPARHTVVSMTSMTEAESAKSVRPGGAAFAGAAFDLALSVPPIALGSWIDLESGSPRNEVALVALVGASFVFALSLAARLARRSRLSLRGHAIVWLAFVAGLPLLRGALELGGAPAFGAVPAWMSWIARASPLAWIVARLDASSSAPAIGAFLLTILLLAIGAAGLREVERGEHTT